MVKQMIISVFSTLGLQGKNFISLKYWLVYYGASNHIISFVDTIHNIWSYSGSLQITIANGMLEMYLYLLNFSLVLYQ